MDPTANLQEQVELAEQIMAECDHRDTELTDEDHDSYRLAELVLALVEWQKKGGFAPDFATIKLGQGAV